MLGETNELNCKGFFMSIKIFRWVTIFVQLPYFRDHKAHRIIRCSIKKWMLACFFSYVRRTGL